MNRFWLLTWSTYGTRLPGDDRGFVGRIRRSTTGERHRNNAVGVEPDRSLRGLELSARSQMKGEIVYLTQVQAELIVGEFLKTCEIRGWQLNAAAVMEDHIHLVVGVPDDPDPALLLKVFKSYASRALNDRFGDRQSATWWTASGSRRVLRDDSEVSGL